VKTNNALLEQMDKSVKMGAFLLASLRNKVVDVNVNSSFKEIIAKLNFVKLD